MTPGAWAIRHLICLVTLIIKTKWLRLATRLLHLWCFLDFFSMIWDIDLIFLVCECIVMSYQSRLNLLHPLSASEHAIILGDFNVNLLN
jgi:hypothetical protein